MIKFIIFFNQLNVDSIVIVSGEAKYRDEHKLRKHEFR